MADQATGRPPRRGAVAAGTAPEARAAPDALARRAPRILYLAGHFMAPPFTSGSARPLELARRFVADGHAVTLLSTDAHLRAAGLTLEDIPPAHLGGVEVVLTRSGYDNAMGFARRKVEFASQALRQAALAVRGPVDLVYATSTPLTVLGPALARRQLRGTPFVFEVRDVWPQVPIEIGALAAPWQQRAAHALADLGYRRARHVVVLSPGMRDMVVARGVDPARVTVAPNAADPVQDPPARVAAATDDTGDDVVDDLASWLDGAAHAGIYAGTIGLANDVGWLVDLVTALDPDLDLRLAVVGDGARVPAVAARLARAPDQARRRLRMFPGRPRGELAAAMARVDFAVSTFKDLPSLSSNSPNKVFDAWAHGVPVVANNGGWLADELATTGAGLAVGRDPAAAAADLRAWVTEPGRLEAAGAAARRLATTTYNWDVTYATIRRAITTAMVGPQQRAGLRSPAPPRRAR